MAQDLSEKELLKMEVEQLKKEVRNPRAPVSLPTSPCSWDSFLKVWDQPAGGSACWQLVPQQQAQHSNAADVPKGELGCGDIMEVLRSLEARGLENLAYLVCRPPPPCPSSCSHMFLLRSCPLWS